MSDLAGNLFTRLLEDIALKRFEDNVLSGEMELCEMYNVSRSTLRSVLSVLSSKGVINRQAKKRAEINPCEEWDLFDPDILQVLEKHMDSKELLSHIFYIRLTLEPNACALAALNSLLSDLYGLNEGLEKMKQGLATKDIRLFSTGDLQFHRWMYKSTHNPFFNSLQEFMLHAAEISISNTAKSSESELRAAVQNHEKLLEAIRVKNAGLARQLMIELLQESVTKVFADDLPAYMFLFDSTQRSSD